MNCTGIRCPMQHGKVDPATCPCVSYCPQATPPKRNADRIRAMTDEDLAKFLSESATDKCAPGHYDCYPWDHCAECWLDWLRQEADP